MRHENFMKKSLTILFLLVSYPAFAQTITGVSGTPSNGQSITISGSDFGPGPTLLIFDDFEGGSDGSQLSTNLAKVGEWDYIQTVQNTSYSSANRVSGNLAARFDSYNYPPNEHPVIRAVAPTTFNSFYISWWAMIPAGNIFPGCGYGGCNWKTIWACDDNGCESDGPNMTVSGGGESSWAIMGNGYPGVDGTHWLKNPYDSYTDLHLPIGVWHRFQFHLKGSTTNSGKERIWVTTSAGNTRFVERDDQVTLNVDHTDKLTRFHVNGYVRDTPNSYPTFDDVYIAYGENAQARVEIGNANTYFGCNSLTMCTPTAWGDSSITCTVRQGNLPEGSAWLYITDADGNQSAGYPITMGSGGITLPPPVNTPASFQLNP